MINHSLPPVVDGKTTPLLDGSVDVLGRKYTNLGHDDLERGGDKGSVQPLWWIGTVVLAYSAVSIAIVYVNRALFSVVFPYPILISSIQQFGCFIAFQGITRVCCAMSVTDMEPPPMSLQAAFKVFPLSVTFVGMIAVSNKCLQHVQISSYQVARSMTLIFSSLLSIIFLNDYLKFMSWMAIIITSSGFFIASMDRAVMSTTGVLLGLGASLFRSVYYVQMKKQINRCTNSLVLMNYNAINSAWLLVIVTIIVGEGRGVWLLPTDPRTKEFYILWGLLVISVFCALGAAVGTYYTVQITSPMSFTIIGYAKTCFQTMGAMALLGDVVSLKLLLGIVLTLGGSLWYSILKLKR